MNYAADQSHIRYINQKLILTNISNKENVSRAELSRTLKISKSAMTENILALLEMRVIEEKGEGVSMSRGGRKPILLSFNKSYAYIIAIDLSFEEPIFILANIGGEILNKFTINIPTSITYDFRLKLIKNAIFTLLSSYDLKITDLEVICISTPGIYSPSTKLYIASKQFANWHIDRLHDDLQIDLDIDVIISNDVNSATLGELNHGIAKTMTNVLYIGCGLAIGAGIITDGILCKGFRCSAGSISNFKLNCLEVDDDLENTLENKINIISFINKFNDDCPESTKNYFKQHNKNITDCTFKDITHLFKQNDEYTLKHLDNISEILANAINNMLCILNSEIVIIGGDYSVFASHMIPIISKKINKIYYYPINIVAADLGEYSGIYGLFSIAKEYLFDKLCSNKK